MYVDIEIISNNTYTNNLFGTVDYSTGKIVITSVNITSVSNTDGTIRILAIPNSNDVVPTREQVVQKLLEYLDKEVKAGTKVNHIMRHTVGLYHGQVGSKEWKRYLSDNMMARDSDFQKAKHIMAIVQNNEKANQVSS